MSFVAAAIGVGGSLLGGLIGAGASESAASQQAAAAMRGQDISKGMFDTVQGNEKPFLQAGQGAVGNLNYLLGIGGTPGDTSSGGPASVAPGAGGGYGSLNSPFTSDTFKSMSPAYQFQLQQGGQGVLNQNASAQGAESGAALKDLMSFNQGLAGTSFNNAFNQYQTQNNNIFGRLNSIATLGSNAGSNSATGASTFANGISNSAQNVGTALAGGTVGAANALTGGLQSAVPWLQSGAGGNPNANPNSYQNTAGQNVYTGISQNGGLGGGIGNMVADF